MLWIPRPLPYLLFLACRFGTSCEEVEAYEHWSSDVDRSASFHRGLLPRLSKTSGSLEQHQTLVLCCLSSQGNVWGQAKYVHDHFCFAFLSAASSAFRDLNLAGLTNSSAQGGASQLRGQSGSELEGDP